MSQGQREGGVMARPRFLKVNGYDLVGERYAGNQEMCLQSREKDVRAWFPDLRTSKTTRDPRIFEKWVIFTIRSGLPYHVGITKSRLM